MSEFYSWMSLKSELCLSWLTDAEGDAGQGGGGVDGAAEQGLDVVSLLGVLAPAQVRAGL